MLSSNSFRPSTDNQNDVLELQNLLSELSQDTERQLVASEIEVLQSIFGDDSIRVWHPLSNGSKNYLANGSTDGTVRYEVLLNLADPHEDITLRVLVSLPSTYPSSSPPQLQLLSRYVGAFGADANLFGSILRTYISINGVEWSEDTVCVFDGLQNILERCTTWYQDKLSAEKAGELGRDDSKEHHLATQESLRPPDLEDMIAGVHEENPPVALPAGVHIITAEPITDRKSSFIGRACRIQHPSEVPIILSHLMADRRISRAAHPIINAWRCQVDGILHQDNDDDGETAAGGRIAHLLQILEVNDVLVVVTRYFGGIHIGPDRFKHINQAARNALDLGGFLDTPIHTDSKKGQTRGKKH
ncbi:ribosomal protein S5 domain 2-type protein [Crepidotus variabilis]|uniref:Ribosomal protein S5 domain 2-type protein n=1 Tax=Crepidotus variabilis TaxID=179855 RepID=A0A9P6JW26_9AGAR|nr:ribosomal protein S5 domain 2-type protein [Crepidotus variabilis]